MSVLSVPDHLLLQVGTTNQSATCIHVNTCSRVCARLTVNIHATLSPAWWENTHALYVVICMLMCVGEKSTGPVHAFAGLCCQSNRLRAAGGCDTCDV